MSEAFLQRALLVGVLASLLGGLVGPLMLLRQAGYMGASMTHAVLGGVGAALYFGLSPMAGALVVAAAAALWMSLVKGKSGQEEEALSGGLWSVGVAVGVLFLAKTPGFQADLMSYLFGNVLLVSTRDLIAMAVLVVTVAIVLAAYHKQFLALCFDEEHAYLQGLPVKLYDALLLLLVALSVVVLMRVVGVVLVMALLSLPAAVALAWSHRFWLICLAAACIGLVVSVSGLAVSYQADLPVGATTVLLAAAVYGASRLVRPLVSKR